MKCFREAVELEFNRIWNDLNRSAYSKWCFVMGILILFFIVPLASESVSNGAKAFSGFLKVPENPEDIDYSARIMLGTMFFIIPLCIFLYTIKMASIMLTDAFHESEREKLNRILDILEKQVKVKK